MNYKLYLVPFKHEKNASVHIDESKFEEISGTAIHYTSDLTVSSSVKIMRSRITLRKNESKPARPSIKMSVRNDDNIEITNNELSSLNGGGIHIYLYDKHGTVNIVNNIICGYQNGSEAVYVVNAGGNATSKLLLAGNYLNSNDIAFPYDMVAIVNITSIVQENIFDNNTARYTMNWVGSSKTNSTSLITKNVFFLNKALANHTLLLQPNGHEIISENYFYNPTNEFELGNLPSIFPDTVVDATSNWWGSVDPEIIIGRINDKRRATDLPLVIYQPFLLSPTQIFPTGKCIHDNHLNLYFAEGM